MGTIRILAPEDHAERREQFLDYIRNGDHSLNTTEPGELSADLKLALRIVDVAMHLREASYKAVTKRNDGFGSYSVTASGGYKLARSEALELAWKHLTPELDEVGWSGIDRVIWRDLTCLMFYDLRNECDELICGLTDWRLKDGQTAQDAVKLHEVLTSYLESRKALEVEDEDE